MPANPSATNGTTDNQTIKKKASAKKAAAKKPAAPRKATTTAVKAPGMASSAPTVPAEILFQEEPQFGHEPIPPFIWIDHPVQSEQLMGTEYVIRLGVGGAEQVEISIDRGAWLPCRWTSGFWWYDWTGISKGNHTLVARMRTPGGQWYRTPVRNISY